MLDYRGGLSSKFYFNTLVLPGVNFTTAIIQRTSCLYIQIQKIIPNSQQCNTLLPNFDHLKGQNSETGAGDVNES
ncbi:MAG TPA: hypothetical protein DCQ26_17130 [Marinilabiliales bacterium]|jgi:hypothetical protein|nr:MAG: hypothetical protein A2W84_11180 [Bacteroidetes bacterium GWC2_40_13]OFX75074.1 MAG: hypothetical protein A2W96_17300 [Bacteroidetes bacterium GWD2_40_43]OFX91145.1 MAG: hypothetical protein A2W97_00090 [Bacteroidetes bacterium GWE2_40_63]OFZ25872.1 MAG: hypothetical protein A2437_15965 [Bacteroidetes bacterium RIFOXYC2_FULL_40_12]HAN00320.1 hypothetical protein [Marinilabiliales bacterium]